MYGEEKGRSFKLKTINQYTLGVPTGQSCPIVFIKFCKALSLASISAISLSGSTGSEASFVTSAFIDPCNVSSPTEQSAADEATFSFSAPPDDFRLAQTSPRPPPPPPPPPPPFFFKDFKLDVCTAGCALSLLNRRGFF